MLCGNKTISGVKNTTICCGFVCVKTAAHGGRFSRFGFVAVFRTGNEVGSDESFSTSYKGEFSIQERFDLFGFMRRSAITNAMDRYCVVFS